MRDIYEKERLKKENFALKQRIRELEGKESTLNCLEYSKIFSIISEIICVLDLETSHFIQVNPSFKELVGMEGDEVYSHPIKDFIHPEDHEKTRKAGLEELLKGKRVVSFENRYRNGDGSYSLLQWTAYPDIDQKKVYATARNITAQREYEQQLEFQSQLLDQIDDRITATDLEGNITYVNQAELNTFGKEHDDLIGNNIRVFGEDEDYIRQQEILELAKENGFWNGKVANFDKNGNKIILNSRIRLFYDKYGEPEGLIGISSDITKLENRETALIASEHRFKAIFEQNALGEVFGNAKGIIENTNQEFCDITGYTKNELLGKELKEFIWKEDRRLIDKLTWNSNNEERDTLQTVLRLCHKDNYSVWCRVYLKFEKGLNGNSDYYIGAFTDITEVYESQLALQENEELFRTMFTQSAVGISIVSPEGEYLQGNIKFSEITGYSFEELKKLHFEKLTIKEDYEREMIELKKMLNGEITGYDLEKRIIHKAGNIIWIHLYVNMVSDNNGNTKYWIATIVDRNKQVQSKEKLAKLTDRFRLAVKSADIGIWDLELDNNSLHWDKRMYELYGLDNRDSVIGFESWKSRVHPNDMERASEEVALALRGEKDLDTIFRVVWKDESIHHLRVFAIMEHDSQGKPERLIGVNYDITESVKSKLNLEAALEEKEILLRELYHRTKNNMQVICSMLDLEAMNLDNEALNASFEEMSHRIQTMSLVHNKLYQTKHLSRIDLKDYLKDLAELLLKSNSRPDLELSLETELLSSEVVIDIAIPIGLVINELITNSLKYAFPVKKSGKITLILEKEDGFLILTYADDGIGFPEGFDIKKDHNLGLLLVQKLVNGQLGGKLRTRSEDGCAFQMKFNDNIYDERV